MSYMAIVLIVLYFEQRVIEGYVRLNLTGFVAIDILPFKKEIGKLPTN